MLNKASVLITMSVLSLSVHADIYHFNGVITDVLGPDITQNVGDQFNFSIEIDLQSPGYRTIGGSIDLLNSTPDYTYYAANYIFGDAVENVAADLWTNYYYIEQISSGSATISVLNNLDVFAGGVLSIESWDTAPNLQFIQNWKNDSLVNHQISGQITSFTVDDDSDSDGLSDPADNCTLVANADQRDTNGDGYGNLCDPDLNNDGLVNFADVALWAPFFNTVTNGDEDLNGDGFANFGDFAIFPDFFLQPPGPSGTAP